MNLTTVSDKKSILLSNIYPTLHSPYQLPKNAVRSKVKGMNHIAMAFSFNLPSGQIAHVTEIIMNRYNITFSELVNAINNNPYNYVFEKMPSFLGVEDDMPMYVLTNESTHYGAGGICMVNFVNHCQKAPYYWIHSKKPFQSMEEIENAFEIAYKKSKFIKRKYFEYENQNEILDENMRFMKQYPEIIQRFENANTGYQQDKIMACIACYLHPGFKEYYQSIQSVDLSPKTVLDMQLPEEPFFDYHPEIKHDRTAALAFYEEKFNTEPPNFDNDFDYP